MKANELRIGNLVNYRIIDEIDERKEWLEVSEIDYDDLRILGIKDEMNNDYQPIPLTEEWLLKFSFDNLGTFGFARGDFKLEFTKNIITKQDCNFIFWINLRIIRLYSVHQLQNLYFALIGEELGLK